MRSVTAAILFASIIVGCAIVLATPLFRSGQIGAPDPKASQSTSHAAPPPRIHYSRLASDVHRIRILADQADAARQERAAKESMWIACEQLNSGSVENLIAGDKCGGEPYPTEETPAEQTKIAKINAFNSFMNTAIGGCMANVQESTSPSNTLAQIGADASNNRAISEKFDKQRISQVKACVKAQTGYD
jgi:hypothetical protein